MLSKTASTARCLSLQKQDEWHKKADDRNTLSRSCCCARITSRIFFDIRLSCSLSFLHYSKAVIMRHILGKKVTRHFRVRDHLTFPGHVSVNIPKSQGKHHGRKEAILAYSLIRWAWTSMQRKHSRLYFGQSKASSTSSRGSGTNECVATF